MSQLASQDVYMAPRPSKRPRLGLKSRFYSKKKQGYQYSKPGMLNCVRWSAKDTSNNCVVQYTGSDTVNSQDVAVQFALSDTQGSTELTNLFDSFRITKIQYRWVLTRTPDWATTSTLRGYSVRVTWCHDFNSSSPITRAAQYQRANLREEMLSVDKPETKWYTLKPAVLGQMWESAVATSYSPKWKQWLDTGDSATPHYGILGTYSELNAGLALRLEAKLFMEFKGIS